MRQAWGPGDQRHQFTMSEGGGMWGQRDRATPSYEFGLVDHGRHHILGAAYALVKGPAVKFRALRRPVCRQRQRCHRGREFSDDSKPAPKAPRAPESGGATDCIQRVRCPPHFFCLCWSSSDIAPSRKMRKSTSSAFPCKADTFHSSAGVARDTAARPVRSKAGNTWRQTLCV